ncbi:MAG: OmpA family protein [Bacteroidota bacterium]|nr:OmpA family protein [Bacteroidota bacterium]
MELNKKLYIFLFVLELNQIAHTQNLVPNPSFEEYYTAEEVRTMTIPSYIISMSQDGYWEFRPKKKNDCSIYGTLTFLFCKKWTNCNHDYFFDSPDLYNRCSIQFGVPKSEWVFNHKILACNYQNAKSGSGYMGIFVSNTKFKKLNFVNPEFMQTKLIHPLQVGQQYYTEFFVNRADYSTVSTDCLGLYFSDKEIKVNDYHQMYRFKPQITNPKGKVIEDTVSWVKVSGIYTAKGGEQYIIIGDFYPQSDNTIKYDNIKSKDFVCYYLIDDVSVISVIDNSQNDKKEFQVKPTNESTECINYKHINIGVSVVIKNIYFEFGKSDLLPTSFKELDKLVQYMGTASLAEIEVDGFTDDVGTDDYNLKLSISRAKSVVEYIISKGVDKSRIIYKGYGRTKPLQKSQTEKDRAINRRVEFKVLKK